LRDKLLALVELQKVDLEIATLRKASEVWPKQMADLEKELAAARSALEAERSRAQDVERQKLTLEQSITEEKDKVKKWEQRLSEQRSTREYSALAREIDIAKKSILTSQEEVVALGKQLGEVREAVKAKEQEFGANQGRITGELGGLRDKLAEAEKQVGALAGQRDSAARAVDANLLRRYDAIRKKRMPAMVPVVAGKCMGCNMQIPPQQYNTLCATLGTDVCPSCSRIIHAQEALEPRQAT
jgi:predicted  nucleic acid-binding Zn-ribbon protein